MYVIYIYKHVHIFTTESRMVVTMLELQLFQKKTCVATVPYFLPSQKNWQCCKRQKLDQGYSCFFGAGSVCPQNIEHKFQQTGVCVCAGTKNYAASYAFALHGMIGMQTGVRPHTATLVSQCCWYMWILFGWTCSPWSIMILIGICLAWKSLRASSEKINYRSSTPCQFGIKCIKAIEKLLHDSLNLLDQHGQLLRQGRQQNRIWFVSLWCPLGPSNRCRARGNMWLCQYWIWMSMRLYVFVMFMYRVRKATIKLSTGQPHVKCRQ